MMPTTSIAYKYCNGFQLSLGIDLHYQPNFRRPDADNYGALSNAVNKRLGYASKGNLRDAEPINLGGHMDYRYELSIAVTVTKRVEDYISHGRVVLFCARGNEARDVVRSAVPITRKVVREKMRAAFEGFLEPRQLEECVDFYFREVLGRDNGK